MQIARNAATNGKAEGNSTDRSERANRKEVQRFEAKDQRIIITVRVLPKAWIQNQKVSTLHKCPIEVQKIN